MKDVRDSLYTNTTQIALALPFDPHPSELEGCGVTQEDADDLATCLGMAKTAGVTEV